MKLRVEDQVQVIYGKDKGLRGKIVQVMPASNKIVVEGINKAILHKKANQQLNIAGGRVEVFKPFDASKVMVVDPDSGNIARIKLVIDKDGNKTRAFHVSKQSKKQVKKTAKKKESK